jgi:TolB-like protein/DNA-binding winged helix-turn-helix (wHTH) protein/Tfp pilus assembly protein PilF
MRAGDLCIDLSRQTVSRDGVPVPLPRLSFELLVALATAYPRLLTVEELMDRVWSPAVVNRETVGQRVKLLRQSLDDDPRNPRYVVGVRGRGYRMGPPVTRGPSTLPVAAALRGAATGDGAPPQSPATVPAPASASASASASAPAAAAASAPASAPASADVAARLRFGWLVVAGILLVVATAGIDRLWFQSTQANSRSAIAAPRSVAVLPFADMSEKRDQGYFADGLTGELINRLTTIAGLDVASTTSSFYFKGKPVARSDVAKALRVANFLEGSVQTSGDRLQITAQLVRIDSGYQIWSGSFDRPLTDLFKVQDEIAGAVSRALRPSRDDQYVPRAAPTENIQAYTLYLRAESNITNNGSDEYDAAVGQLHAALALDPGFADAWASLSKAILFKGNTHGTPTRGACAEARTAANRALALNERLEEGHRAAGAIIQYCDGDLSGAEAEFSRAIELQPEGADALRSYAWLLVDAGRFDRARQLAQRAVDRDPLNGWNYVALGDAWWRSGRIAQAEMAYQRAVDVNPATTSLHALYANVLLSAHKAVAAVDEAEREPDPQYRQLTLAIAFDAAGRKSDAEQEVAAYESLHAADDPGEIAVFYACRNDADRAIEWLRKFAAKHVGEFASLPNRIACFKNIESDSRYLALEQEVRRENAARPLTAKVRSFRHVDIFSQTAFTR